MEIHRSGAGRAAGKRNLCRPDLDDFCKLPQGLQACKPAQPVPGRRQPETGGAELCGGVPRIRPDHGVSQQHDHHGFVRRADRTYGKHGCVHHPTPQAEMGRPRQQPDYPWHDHARLYRSYVLSAEITRTAAHLPWNLPCLYGKLLPACCVYLHGLFPQHSG